MSQTDKHQKNEWVAHRSIEKYFQPIDRGEVSVAIEGLVIIGYNRAVPGEVVSLYVLPGHTKKGIGSMLLHHAIEIAKSNTSKVILDSTLNAVDFYRKRGFVEVQKTFIKRGNSQLPCVRMEYKSSFKEKS